MGYSGQGRDEAEARIEDVAPRNLGGPIKVVFETQRQKWAASAYRRR